MNEFVFACEKRPDGEVIFKDQRDFTLPTFWALPGVAREDLEHWLDNEFFEPSISPEACAAKWHGDRMDYHLAVEPLVT